MAVEPGDAQFVSKLDDASKKKAKEELNELNDKDRELAVQSFREWVLQQKWLKTPTSFEFLLRFLRARKFSQLRAREILGNYWTTKTKAPKWFRNVDTHDELLVEVIRTGIYIIPKTLDKHGRRVSFERFGNLDMVKLKKKWGFDLMYKAMMVVSEWANRDENIQVNGTVHVSDMSDVTWGKMMHMFDQEREKVMMKFWQDAIPARIKGIHIYNEPSFFDAMFALFGAFMKQKTKDRMHLHGRNLTKLYEEVGMEVLPSEYLPDDYTGPTAGSTESIMDEMIKDIQTPEFREYMLDLSSDKYGVDLELRKQDDAPVASFRKLNVD